MTIAIHAGRALVGPTLVPLDDPWISLDDDSIIAIGDASPAGTEVVDAAAYTVLPGFIDTHVHIAFYPPERVLHGGVTTVRDLAWPPDQIWSMVERSRDPDWDGPQIEAVGQMLTAPGGYPMRAGWAPRRTGREVRGPDDAPAAVTEQVQRGASAIKIALNPPVGPVLDLDTARAIAAAAAEHDLHVTAHVYGLAELEKAISAGVRELAHMLMSDESIPDEMLRTMVAQEMVIVPTLSCRVGRDRATAIDNLARFAELGGRIVYGTDLGNEGPTPGIDSLEVGSMAEAGLSPKRIITSATYDAARWLKLNDRGGVEPGRRADLIAVEGDPSIDITALERVVMVWRAGRRVR